MLPVIAACAFAQMIPAQAQPSSASDYPKAPIRIVVTVPAGGGVDSVTRFVADKLQQRLGQPIIIENRGGSGGNLGAEAVYPAAPDGYTLMASQPSPLTVNQVLYKKINFDPTKFEPVVLLTTAPNVLAVRPDFPAKTAQEFIAYAKANSGKLNYASQGNGTTSHLTAEMFAQVAGTKLVHVPYRGTAPALNDLIAGHVDIMFVELGAALQLHRGGKLRILAATTEQRVPTLPDIPTMKEAGISGVISDTWNAISAPPKTPPAIIAKLNSEINEVLKMPETRAHFTSLNLQPEGGPPAALAKVIVEDTKRWVDVVRTANVTITAE